MVSGNLTMRSLCSVRESSEGLLGLSTSIVGYPIAAGVRRVVGRWSANIDPGSAFGAGAGGLHSTCLDMRFVESSLGDVAKESTFGVSVTDKRVQTFAKTPLSSTCSAGPFLFDKGARALAILFGYSPPSSQPISSPALYPSSSAGSLASRRAHCYC